MFVTGSSFCSPVVDCKGKPEQVTGIIGYEETKQRNKMAFITCM